MKYPRDYQSGLPQHKEPALFRIILNLIIIKRYASACLALNLAGVIGRVRSYLQGFIVMVVADPLNLFKFGIENSDENKYSYAEDGKCAESHIAEYPEGSP